MYCINWPGQVCVGPLHYTHPSRPTAPCPGVPCGTWGTSPKSRQGRGGGVIGAGKRTVPKLVSRRPIVVISPRQVGLHHFGPPWCDPPGSFVSVTVLRGCALAVVWGMGGEGWIGGLGPGCYFHSSKLSGCSAKCCFFFHFRNVFHSGCRKRMSTSRGVSRSEYVGVWYGDVQTGGGTGSRCRLNRPHGVVV